MESFWQIAAEGELKQGDFIPQCFVPVLPEDFANQAAETKTVTTREYDLIIVTQSCDLMHGKSMLVALCPVWSVADFEDAQASQSKSKWTSFWNNVRKGRVPYLHLLTSPTEPSDNRNVLVVDFREIYSLPFSYLIRRTEEMGDGWHLRSPFLEHFSQAFERFFMRVGLPSSVPEFR